MKKIVEEVEGEGLTKLLGEKVLLMCANYFYTGKLQGVNETCVLLTDPAIVYETGEWEAAKFKDEQKMRIKYLYVQVSAIEAFGVAK